VLAVATWRSARYGHDWHRAGTIDASITCSTTSCGCEYLIKERYTAPAKRSIQGGQQRRAAGGPCHVARPDLFGAALPAVGVMDILRSRSSRRAGCWVDDYGSSDNSLPSPTCRSTARTTT